MGIAGEAAVKEMKVRKQAVITLAAVLRAATPTTPLGYFLQYLLLSYTSLLRTPSRASLPETPSIPRSPDIAQNTKLGATHGSKGPASEKKEGPETAWLREIDTRV